jgi:DNA-binding SARP family transcriptional activator
MYRGVLPDVLKGMNVVASLSKKMFHQLQSFLADNQYEQTAQLLEIATQDFQREGDIGRATVLNAATQICLTCERLRQELVDHEQTRQALVEQEEMMKQQLESLLQIADVLEEKTAVTNGHHSPQPEPATLGMWQRWQRWLKGPTDGPAEASPQNGTNHPYTTNAPLTPIASNGHLETLASSLIDSTAVNGKLADYPSLNTILIAEPPAAEEEKLSPDLTIYSLGTFRVYQKDKLVHEWNGLKGLMILKYLVANQGKPIPKDILMDVFWPDVEPEAARRNLHQAVYSLRQTLKIRQPDCQHILHENDCYLFNPELTIWVDYKEFEKQVRLGQKLEAEGQMKAAAAAYSIAEELYEGDFLNEDLYEEWLGPERGRLRNIYLNITDRLSEYYLEKAEYTIAIALCQKLLVQDNCNEEAYRRLMRCYTAQGQRHLAIRCFQTCQEILKSELDLPPAPETIALFEQLKAKI